MDVPEPAQDGTTPGPARSDVRRYSRRALLGVAAAGAAAVGGATSALAGHEPPAPTPDRPPPSSTLFSHEETRLAFRNHGMHFEFLDQPITPVASHFQLIHFDIPQLAAEGYSFTIGGRVANPRTVTLDELKQRPTVQQPSVMECAGNGRSFAHPRADLRALVQRGARRLRLHRDAAAPVAGGGRPARRRRRGRLHRARRGRRPRRPAPLRARPADRRGAGRRRHPRLGRQRRTPPAGARVPAAPGGAQPGTAWPASSGSRPSR